MIRNKRRLALRLVAPALFLAAALCPTRLLAVERAGYSMEIVVGGRPIDEYAARGTSYVEALKNREYSVRLRNRTGERIAIALSVDGLNSIDAKTTTALDARKWILDPYQTITLDGWQTSSSTARRFFFTTEERSYGSWLGKTQNLGVVAAAVFREKRPQKIVGEVPPQRVPYGASKDSAEAPEASSGGAQSEGAMEKRRAEQVRPDDLAATGIGEETSHPVQQVSFDSESAPTAVLEIRYEYREALVKLGVLPPDIRCDESLYRRERARGFEDSGFAPDPYHRKDR